MTDLTKLRADLREAAGQLRVPRKTYDGWCDGRMPASEAMVRRLMTLIDAHAAETQKAAATPEDGGGS
jgi:hypothetical protein